MEVGIPFISSRIKKLLKINLSKYVRAVMGSYLRRGMAIEPKFKTNKEAKEAGWFSRRHQTNKELLEARRKRNGKNSI